MYASRQSNKSFWTNVGRKMAAQGHSADWAANQLKPEYVVAKQWIRDGHAEQLKRIARGTKSKAKGATPRLPDRYEG